MYTAVEFIRGEFTINFSWHEEYDTASCTDRAIAAAASHTAR